MEMEKYKTDILDNNNWLSNWWQEKLIFILNKKISNFSQSWFLPLLWIIILNLGLYLIMKITNSNFNFIKITLLTVISILSFILISFIAEILKGRRKSKISFYTLPHLISIIIIFMVITMFNYGTLSDIMCFSNIQSYKDYTELSNNKDVFKIWSIHKIILGFIIYHFIISLRRQTKR